MLWMLVGLITFAFGTVKLAKPIRALQHAQKTRLGRHLLTRRDSFPDSRGRQHALLSADSMTMLLLLDSRCSVCRKDARSYLALKAWADKQGVATHLILANDSAEVAQFGRLAGNESVPLRAPLTYLTQDLGIRATPATVIVDRRGIIRGRWLDDVPSHLEVLNVLNAVRPQEVRQK